MSKQEPQQPGFVLPPLHQPNYPSYPQQPGYPAHHQHQAPYPAQPTPAYQHQPFPAPIQQQPGFGAGGSSYGVVSTQWLTNTNFASYLMSATSFHVKQKVELLEVLVGWETANKYTVKDNSGNKVFYVGEETDCCNRNICGKARPFTLIVKDPRGMDVMRFERPLDCGCCFGLFCPSVVTVSLPNGQKLGTVEEECDLLYPRYALKNATGQTVLKIKGPLCPMAFGCGPVMFQVTTPDDISVGTISKEWGGLVRELFTDADFFSMSFPIDLDPAMKAVCLGALFLIVSFLCILRTLYATLSTLITNTLVKISNTQK